MFRKKLNFIVLIITIYFNLLSLSYSQTVNEIKIFGNKRITAETISMFSDISIKDDLNQVDLNDLLKRLYNTNFFDNVEINLNQNILSIFVKENPIIEQIVFEGIKAKKIKKALAENLILKSRSSFNKSFLKKDKEMIVLTLKNLGYYFSNIDVFLEELNDNKVNITYKVDLGDKSKIKKISFIGNKIFKDNKLRGVIISEEYKFWKFISGKKFLNEGTLNLDKRLLKNFYLSKGYYDVSINSSFAKLTNDRQFELIFNINSGNKIYFDQINLNIPDDYNENNFNDLKKLFSKISGEPYSIKSVNKILDEIDTVSINEEYHSIIATVEESFDENKISLVFNINETEKFFIEKINIYGNNITRESAIRNQLEIDEGDPFNEILQAKSINNIKSLNFFKNVTSNIVEGKSPNNKIINIFVEEKATGEISAGAGIGSSGGTVAFSIKENNYLGKGIGLSFNTTITEESLKGLLSVRNPNYKNSDKALNFSVQATELDRITSFGYKSNKVGFSVGTDFEYLDDLNFGMATSSFYESIETDSTASVMQKKQEGNYWDTFVMLNFDYDKRDQKFQTSGGFRGKYFIELPIISKTNTLMNAVDYKYYTELYDQNISTASLYFKAANSLTNNDIKLSERLFVPSGKLRGFEKGKTGPVDGNDHVGYSNKFCNYHSPNF